MKERIKRLVALLLCVCMVLSALTACKGGADQTTEAPEQTTQGTGETEAPKVPEDTLVDDLDSTIAFWRFNEGEGSVVADEKGNYTGSLMNLADETWVPADNGHGIYFAGSANQYVSVPTSEELAPTSITVEILVKLDVAAKYKTDHRLFFKDLQYDIHIWNPTTDGSHKLLFMLETENDKAWIDRIGVDCGDLYDGKFHHIAFTYDGETGIMTAYVDYEVVGTAQTGGGAIVDRNERDLYIGGAYWDGSAQQCSMSTIDAARVSNVALDPSQFLGSTKEAGEKVEIEYPNQMILNYDFAANQANDSGRRYPAVEHDITADNYTEAGLVLDGQNRYLTVENCNLANKMTSYTYETIVQFDPEMKKPGDVMIAFKDLSLMINIWINGDTTNLVFKASSLWQDWVIPYEVYDGKEHHIAVMYDDETLTTKIYIDYQLMGTYTAEKPVAENSNHLYIGAGYWGDALQRPMTGTIKNVRLYNYAIDKESLMGYVISDAVIGDWNFAEDKEDKSENPAATELVGDAKLENGYLVVNGNGALKVQNAGKLAPKSLTMEAIVNFTPEQKSGDHWLFFKDLSFGLKIWVDGDTAKLITQVQTTDKGWAGDSTWTPVNALFDGKDHHVAMVYNAETGMIQVYVDYQKVDEVMLVAGTESKGEIVASDFDLYLGAGYWANSLQQTMRGKMAQARISNYVVAVEDMIGWSAESKVLADWNFAEGSEDKAEEPLTSELAGDAKLEGGYLVVNGAGALKSTDAAKLDPYSLTLEAVVNFTPEQKSGDHWLFFKDLSYGLKIWVDGENAKMITQLQTTDKAWAGDSTWTIVNELFDGKDHHVAMTYNANTGDICIYVDYQLKDQVKLVAGTESKGAVVGTDFDLYMGAGWWADNFQQAMRGKMAQARISNYVVPVEEMIGYTAQ